MHIENSLADYRLRHVLCLELAVAPGPASWIAGCAALERLHDFPGDLVDLCEFFTGE